MENYTLDSMEIKELSQEELSQLCKDWESQGVSPGVLQEFLNFQDITKISCHSVQKDGMVLALFDKRDTLRAYKNMSILFSPTFKLGEGAYEEVSEELIRISEILENIFSHFMGIPLAERGQIKIYNDTEYISKILLDMAQYIKDNYSNLYKVDIYKRWIDIKQKGGTDNA